MQKKEYLGEDMKKMHFILAVIVIAAGLFLSGCSGDDDSSGSDLVLMNAVVFTSDVSNPWAEAVAVRVER